METFFSVFGSQFGLRGTVASSCQPTKKQRSVGRGPLASSILVAWISEGGFREKLHSLGPRGDSLIKEAITLTGGVDDEAITGTYRRRIGTRSGNGRKRVCHAGPLPFRAQRYLPVGGSR